MAAVATAANQAICVTVIIEAGGCETYSPTPVNRARNPEFPIQRPNTQTLDLETVLES